MYGTTEGKIDNTIVLSHLCLRYARITVLFCHACCRLASSKHEIQLFQEGMLLPSVLTK